MTPVADMTRDQLEAEVQRLRGALASVVGDPRLRHLQSTFNIPPAQAKMLLALYGACGSPIAIYDLYLTTKTASQEDAEWCDKIPCVYVSQINKALGEKLIKSHRGFGYYLDGEGIDRVATALGERAAA